MKRRTGAVIAFAIALSLSTTALTPPAAAAVSAQVSFDFFYSSLSPHGSWVVSAEYGRVWQPGVYAPDWNPYYDGHWEYADVGWVWVSDYEWGAIPYHYGTWVADSRFGWVWVPGYTWAPAWVVFRTGPDYIGWAPVAPSFAVGVSFGSAAPVSGSFLFVSTRDFCAPRIRTYVVPDTRARTIVNNTTIVNNLVVQNNIVVNRGPDVRVVEAASRRKIQVAQVESIPRVAPFSQVRRQELAIAPERGRHQVRAAEPASADRPIPQGKDVAQMSRGSSRGNPKAAPPSNEAVVAPSRAPDRESPRAAPPKPAPQPQRTAEKPQGNAAKPPKAFDKPAPDQKKQDPRAQDPQKQDPKKQDPKQQDPKKPSKKKQAPKKQDPNKNDEKQGGGQDDGS